MRILGPKATIQRFRWDLIYLQASLLADTKPEVKALAPAAGALLTELRKERDFFEGAEDLVIVTSAKRDKRDQAVDVKTVEIGGVARSVDKDLYEALFPTQSPTDMTRLALKKQILENDRILGELAKCPADHPLRVGYEAIFTADVAELRAAIEAEDSAEVDLKLARSKLRQCKAKMDTKRVEIHGQLQTLLGSAKAADSFFRKASSAPGEKEESEEEGGAEAAALPEAPKAATP